MCIACALHTAYVQCESKVNEGGIMEKKYILFAIVPVVVAVSMAIFFYGLISDNDANVVIISIQKKTVIYGGSNHLIFSGFVINKGNMKADNVTVHVLWLDMNIGEYEGFCHLGSIGAGESVEFNVAFPSRELVMVSYYTQWVTFEKTI